MLNIISKSFSILEKKIINKIETSQKRNFTADSLKTKIKTKFSKIQLFNTNTIFLQILFCLMQP